MVHNTTESERASERESKRVRGTGSEKERERGREPIVGLLWTQHDTERESNRAREQESERARERARQGVRKRERDNPSSVVCRHDTTENERVKERE